MDFTLTTEQLHWQQVARDFVQRLVKPTVLERDGLEDPVARVPWDWIREASRLGLRTFAFPREYGGVDAGILTVCVVAEEMATGDMGFTINLDQIWKMKYLFTRAMSPDQRERFLVPFLADPEGITCIAITEPGAGSDHQGYYEGTDIDFRTVAIRDGDGYILNGQKQFPANAGNAKLYFVAARTNPRVPLREGGSMFILPPDVPGFVIGKAWDKIGHRLYVNGSFTLENCRLPADNLLLGEGRLMELRTTYLPGSKPESAALNLGVARAAYDDALALVKERTAGRPLADRQALAMTLADMALNLEATRRLIWRAAWLADQHDPQASPLGLLAKVFSAEVAVKVTRRAMEVAGTRGIIEGYPFEKYFRDAATVYHSDGANQMALLRVARGLAQAERVAVGSGI